MNKVQFNDYTDLKSGSNMAAVEAASQGRKTICPWEQRAVYAPCSEGKPGKCLNV
jgi:hypothetical protein